MSGHTGVSWFLFSLWGNVEPRRERRVHLEACQLELVPGQWLKYKLGNSPHLSDIGRTVKLAEQAKN